MKEYTYPVIIGPSFSGYGYRALCPLLPGCSVRGKTRDEAVARIRTALDRRLDRMVARGERVTGEKPRKRPSVS